MNDLKKAAAKSGSWFVLIIVVAGMLLVGATWVLYHRQNPTTHQAVLMLDSAGWVVRARFADHDNERIVPGMLAVFTARALPGQKMAGRVSSIQPDGWSMIEVTVGPKPGSTSSEVIECAVTVDAETIPRDNT